MAGESGACVQPRQERCGDRSVHEMGAARSATPRVRVVPVVNASGLVLLLPHQSGRVVRDRAVAVVGVRAGSARLYVPVAPRPERGRLSRLEWLGSKGTGCAGTPAVGRERRAELRLARADVVAAGDPHRTALVVDTSAAAPVRPRYEFAEGEIQGAAAAAHRG